MDRIKQFILLGILVLVAWGLIIKIRSTVFIRIWYLSFGLALVPIVLAASYTQTRYCAPFLPLFLLAICHPWFFSKSPDL